MMNKKSYQIGILGIVGIFSSMGMAAAGFEFPDNLAPIPDAVENIMKQYCADSPNGNMTADLVDTGKINSTYATWNCEYLEEKQKLGEEISKDLDKVIEQFK